LAASSAYHADFPLHVAIIMDGNGRWAQARHRPRVFGHQAGVKTVRRIVEDAADMGIQYLTLYSFSKLLRFSISYVNMLRMISTP